MPNKQSSPPEDSTMPCAKNRPLKTAVIPLNSARSAPQVSEDVEDCGTIEKARAVRREIVSALADLGYWQVKQVRDFVEVVAANVSNAQSPIEDFIVDLPRHWKRSADDGRGLTPDDIVHMIDGPDEMRSWFEDAVAITRLFSTRYAHAVAGTGSSEDEA